MARASVKVQEDEEQYVEERKSYVPDNDIYEENDDDSANIDVSREAGRTSDLIPQASNRKLVDTKHERSMIHKQDQNEQSMQ